MTDFEREPRPDDGGMNADRRGDDDAARLAYAARDADADDADTRYSGADNGDVSSDADIGANDTRTDADIGVDDADLYDDELGMDADIERDASWSLDERFADLSDEEVVALAQQGDKVAVEYLLCKYKNFVRSKARSYFLIGADHEDIVQEGMIGLFKAVRDYQPEKLSSFRAFAELCVTRQIITAIKTATRQKHVPLNSYVSLNKPIYDEESDRTLMDVIIESRAQNPEELIIGREDIDAIRGRVDQVLSGLEQDVLGAYLDGKSYQEIADKLGRHVKSIDNALQRVKRKLERFMEEARAQGED